MPGPRRKHTTVGSTAKKGDVDRNTAEQQEGKLSIHTLLSVFMFYVLSVCITVKKLNEFIVHLVITDQLFPTKGKRTDNTKVGL